MKCLNCNIDTDNPKFCSKSCSCSFINKANPRRKKIPRYCTHCGNQFTPARATRKRLCYDCDAARISRAKIELRPLSYYHSRESVADKHPSWANSHIRALNRHWNQDLTKKPCARCGYDKHVELCHIQAITSFPETALLGEVNSPRNVIQLCPNCHWELDHGHLAISDITT
jgi:predicted RNA-binding Zn-ribbon protein involved in translation (DUF1610 family)